MPGTLLPGDLVLAPWEFSLVAEWQMQANDSKTRQGIVRDA